ncbi:TPA: replication initiator protein A [Burkholderia vietnamiensis]|nr:replication initiator protein A [Burkholderia vietnamiensis]
MIIDGRKIPIKTKDVKALCEIEFELRAVPNYIVRSAVFGIKASGKEVFMENVQLPCLTGNTHMLRYNGEKLGQLDFDVFQIISEIWHKIGCPDAITISKYKILSLLKKTDGSENYQALVASLDRLASCTFFLETQTHRYCRGLINGHTIDKQTGAMSILIQPDFMTLFEADKSCYQEFEKRRSLRGELTKWLYNFYSSQQNFQSHEINFIRELCGSESVLRQFKHKLGRSLQQLVEKQAIKAYEIVGTRVCVTPTARDAGKSKPASATQVSTDGAAIRMTTTAIEANVDPVGVERSGREYVFRERRRTSAKVVRRGSVAL